MRFLEGKIIENPLVTRGIVKLDALNGSAYIYVPNDVEFRTVSTEEGCIHKVLRKAVFHSQDEFTDFVTHLGRERLHERIMGRTRQQTWIKQYKEQVEYRSASFAIRLRHHYQPL